MHGAAMRICNFQVIKTSYVETPLSNIILKVAFNDILLILVLSDSNET